ncbi:MAG: UDP-N-acetylglucosamine 2-epimerase (non-hydrolyzing) [candidate division WOR-3 bacterium]|nr:MAG: UDP-N-acetylglucosamine 2-epimerase (non-hydrolyzing) [candidate division WOR-3 bacterium]
MAVKRVKVLFCFGTRPEAIKLAPVITLLKKDKRFDIKICVTAQHREMLDQVLGIFKIVPDHDLNIMAERQTLFDVSQKVLKGMKRVLEYEDPNLLIVQGDTTTSFIAVLSAFYKKIKIAHVEAGLRSYDKYQPFPEEINRRLISHIVDINFAPTQKSKQYLIKENIPGEIFITGNTVVDALHIIVKTKKAKLPMTFCDNNKVILLTVHRRENFGAPLSDIFNAIKRILSDNNFVEVAYPVHPNPNVARIANRELRGVKNIHLLKPLDYATFLKMMMRSDIILTDSGGIQEEAPTFGKPVLILRKKTERPEAIEFRTARLVGTNTSRIIIETQKLLSSAFEYRKLVQKNNPFGDGKAARRIHKYLLYYFGYTKKRPRDF